MIRNLMMLALASLCMLLAVQDTQAQVRGILRERAIEALGASQKEEQKQEEQKEQKEQNVEQAPQQNRQRRNPASGFMERQMMSALGFNQVKFEPRYNFSSSMAMEIETQDADNNRDKVLYSTFFNPDDLSFALMFDQVNKESGQKQKSTLIFDMKNYAMLILTEENGERSGIAMSIPKDTTQTQTAAPEQTVEYTDYVHPLYTATGRSKQIAGIACKEYTYKGEGGSIDLWVARDQKLNLSNAYNYMNGFQALAAGGWAWGMGMVMEMVFRDDEQKTQTHMIVKEIKQNSPRQLDISSYNILGIGGEK